MQGWRYVNKAHFKDAISGAYHAETQSPPQLVTVSTPYHGRVLQLKCIPHVVFMLCLSLHTLSKGSFEWQLLLLIEQVALQIVCCV